MLQEYQKMNEDIIEPKDLGLKMGTPEEVQWTEVKKNQVETIRASKINIAISEVVLKLAEEQIDIEKEKFKK